MEIDVREAVRYLIETRPWDAIFFLILLTAALINGIIEVLRDFYIFVDDSEDR